LCVYEPKCNPKLFIGWAGRLAKIKRAGWANILIAVGLFQTALSASFMWWLGGGLPRAKKKRSL